MTLTDEQALAAAVSHELLQWIQNHNLLGNVEIGHVGLVADLEENEMVIPFEVTVRLKLAFRHLPE